LLFRFNSQPPFAKDKLDSFARQLLKMVLDAYTYVFAIGSCFALLEAFNNGASKFLSHMSHPKAIPA
jgi:hypothetical protein